MNAARTAPKIRHGEIMIALIQAAREQGVLNVTRRRVAEIVGVTEPLINHYVGDVDALRNAVIEEAIRIEDLDLIAQIMAAKHPRADRLPIRIKRAVVDRLLTGETVE